MSYLVVHGQYQYLCDGCGNVSVFDRQGAWVTDEVTSMDKANITNGMKRPVGIKGVIKHFGNVVDTWNDDINSLRRFKTLFRTFPSYVVVYELYG